MSISWRQLWTLLRTMIRMDFRSRSPLGGGRRPRSSNALVMALVFYLIIGAMIAFSIDLEGIAPDVRLTLLLTIVTVYLIFSILAEYQQILLAPEDGDILYWRPINSRTLFAARCLHIFLYVNLLSAALLAIPSILLLIEVPRNLAATWLAFVVAGTGNAALATAIAVLLYSALLRHVPSARLKDVLVWFQVITSFMVFLGYHILGPLVQRTVQFAGGTDWIRALPGRWFAALPEMVGWGVSVESLTSLGIGVLATLIVTAVALQHLAPQYQAALTEQDSADGSAGVSDRTHNGGRWAAVLGTNLLRLPQRLGRWSIRGSAGKAGFDFFVSMFRGDSRLKSMLLPLATMPPVFVLFGLIQGSLVDPYATGLESAVSSTSPMQEQSLMMPYLAVYSLVLIALTLARSLSISSSWRAGWVFYASPLTQFERFHRGVVWGAVATLIVPTMLLLVVLLSVVWRNPLHVVVHLSLPIGLVCLFLPLTLMSKPEPPFTREVLRHDRVSQLLHGVLPMLPLFLVGILHYQFRANSGILLLAATVLVAIGSLLAWSMRRRISSTLHAQSFDG